MAFPVVGTRKRKPPTPRDVVVYNKGQVIAVCLLYILADATTTRIFLCSGFVLDYVTHQVASFKRNGMLLFGLRNRTGWNVLSWALHVLCWSCQPCIKQALNNLTKVGDIHFSFYYTSQVRRAWGILVAWGMKLHTCSDTWKNIVILHLLLRYFVSSYAQSVLKNQYAEIKNKQWIMCIMSLSLL